MVIERYEGNIASSVATVEGEIIIIAKKIGILPYM